MLYCYFRGHGIEKEVSTMATESGLSSVLSLSTINYYVLTAVMNATKNEVTKLPYRQNSCVRSYDVEDKGRN